MKARALIACITILAAFAFLAACQPDSLAETDSCMECHSGYTGADVDVLARTAQYEESGHSQGPRTLVESTLDTGHIYVFHGSNAMYCNGSSCSKCHTHQGFVDYVETGSTLSFYGAASPPGCFTCHKPHVSGDFSLRKTASETLIGGGSFDGGKGNLCATCHKALTNATTFLPDETGGIYPKAWTNRDGMHHGPQADFILGANHRPFPSKAYVGASPHLAGNGNLPNSCNSCHLYEPGGRLSGTLELGGHGMYLTGDVHGTNSNVIGACRNCHTYPSSATTLVSAAAGSMTGGFEASTTSISPIVANVNASLDDIRALRDLLIVWFGTNANWPTAGRRITAVTGGDVAVAGEWQKDWVFTSSISSANFTLAEDESFAYWNFLLFIEDKSHGIHNPAFAYEILYDSAEALGINVSAFTRP
jgi:hypothetical protein